MLQGPISNGPLGFDTHHIRSGLTPNESGIRSGLTPGGSGSMFPVPSPSPASFLQFGTSTPSTMEFQKTALSAASALRKQHPPPALSAAQPPLIKPEFSATVHDDRENTSTSKPRQLSNAFDTDPAHHAANGLYMLAQAHQNDHQYSSNNVPPPANAGAGAGPKQSAMASVPAESSPTNKKRAIVTTNPMARGMLTNNSPTTVRGVSEMSEEQPSDSDESDDGKPRGGDGKSGKRGATRTRKGDGKSNKRSKTTQGSANGSGDDQDMDMQGNDATKKMTDEEKRKNFLERNRFVVPLVVKRRAEYQLTRTPSLYSVAALKCRQRKKQWLQNLQTKVEYYSQENDALTSQVASLREEIVALKTLLLAHKDCPIARATNMGMDTIHSALAAGASEYGNHANFTSMGVIAPPPAVHGHPRRYS